MHHGCYRKYCFPPSRVILWKLDSKNCSYSASCVATMASFLIYVLNKWHIYLYFVIAYYLYLLTLKCFKTFIVTERCSLLRLFSIRFWMRFSDATQSSSVAKTFLHLYFFFTVSYHADTRDEFCTTVSITLATASAGRIQAFQSSARLPLFYGR